MSESPNGRWLAVVCLSMTAALVGMFFLPWGRLGCSGSAGNLAIRSGWDIMIGEASHPTPPAFGLAAAATPQPWIGLGLVALTRRWDQHRIGLFLLPVACGGVGLLLVAAASFGGGIGVWVSLAIYALAVPLGLWAVLTAEPLVMLSASQEASRAETVAVIRGKNPVYLRFPVDAEPASDEGEHALAGPLGDLRAMAHGSAHSAR